MPHEDVEKLEPLCIAAGDAKWDSYCGKQCGRSPQNLIVNHHTTQQFYLRVYTKRTESGDSNRSLYTNVYRSIIHHNQKVETTQILTDR